MFSCKFVERFQNTYKFAAYFQNTFSSPKNTSGWLLLTLAHSDADFTVNLEHVIVC